ncbi:CRISPR-associated endonuclease Cas1 [Nocardioides hungaricus]
MRPDVPGLPETIPARMVNEFVYCRRLFYLEWVQSRFTTNHDVEEGLHVHRVVDRPSGDLPGFGEALASGQRVTSVWLSSHRLGITAKVDLVQGGDDDSVVPVDYKKGRPDPDGGPWPSDRMQSLLQALLLRDSGYACHRAEVWYDDVKRRVVIDVDDDAIAEVTAVLGEAWTIAASDSPPPPLVDSPKCPRCSLVGICLPDETHALTVRASDRGKVRRIIPDAPESRPVYALHQGAVVGVRRGRLEVDHESGHLASYRLIDVSQLCLIGNVQVSTQAMRELFAREVPVLWFSYGGWFSGVAEGLPAKNVDLRRSQFLVSADQSVAIAGAMVAGKIRNSRTMLRRNARCDVATTVEQLAQLVIKARNVRTVPSLLGIEGAAARLYFGRFTTMIAGRPGVDADAFDSNGRSRRPPPDPVNALLSFAYALLAKDLTVVSHAVGFDPYVGFLHRPRFGRPALALDLAEEFRPLIAESTVLQVLNNGEVGPRDFLQKAGGCQLTTAGRRTVLRAYERRLDQEIKHPHFGYQVTYRRAMDVQARMLAAHLLGELPSYLPFMTR